MPRPAKTKAKKIVTRPAGRRMVTRRFYDKKAPELPFWIFLTFGVLVLTAIFAAKQFGFPDLLSRPSSETLRSQGVGGPNNPATTFTVSEPTLPPKTATIADATEPRLTTLDNKIYLIFKNPNGGYSVNTYGADLNQVGISQWLTNGLVIPNQKTAAPLYLDGRWYLAYLGGDGFLRLGNYDVNWNRQREITFASKLGFDGVPSLLLSNDGNLVNIKIYDSVTKHFFSATKDLGLSADEDRSSENWPTSACPVTKLTINGGTYQASSDGATVTLSRI